MTHDDDDRSFDVPHTLIRLDAAKVKRKLVPASECGPATVEAPDPARVGAYLAASRLRKAKEWSSFNRRTMCYYCTNPGACCKGLVAVSTSESLALSFAYPDLLQARRLEIVEAAYDELADAFDPGVYAKRNRACVLSNPDGSCAVYQDRPMSCAFHNLAGHYGYSSRDCSVPNIMLPSLDTMLHGMQAHIELDAKCFQCLPGFWPGLATGLLMTAFVANGDPLPEGLPEVPVMRMQPDLAMALMARRPQDLRVD